MPEKEEKSINEKTKKKGVKTAAAVVILLVLCCLIGIGIRSVQKRQTYENHIAAAEKYLVDLNYEQAIVEYTLALEIEPNEAALLDALEQTYLDYAQSLADAGDYDGAIAVLEEGVAKIGRESLQAKEEEYKKLKAQKEEEERLAAEAAKKAEAEELISMRDVVLRLLRMNWQSGVNYCISDAQTKEWCEQAVALVEPYLAGDFGSVSDSMEDPYYLSGLKCLADAYYLLGEYDLCMEKRWQIYEACGSPDVEDFLIDGRGVEVELPEYYYYIPIEHTETTIYDTDKYLTLVDGYGKILKYQRQSEYDSVDWEYYYNEQGKREREKRERDSNINMTEP